MKTNKSSPLYERSLVDPEGDARLTRNRSLGSPFLSGITNGLPKKVPNFVRPADGCFPTSPPFLSVSADVLALY